MNTQLNCWEFKKCGRQPGGEKVAELGVCSAATDTSKNGVNRGQCAGRCCWRAVGTLCGGRIQGTYAKKLDSCLKCEFFERVQEEEGPGFKM
jgi:hypothetical protein